MEILPKSLASVATIEGASGTGKTTLLRGLASRYGCAVIEVGVIVRALAWRAQREAVPVRDAVAALAALDSKGALSFAAARPSAMATMDIVLRGEPVGDAAFGPQLTESLAAATLDEEGMAWVHAIVRERARGRRAAISGREVATRTVPGVRLVVRLEANVNIRRARKLEQMGRAGLEARWRDDAGLLLEPSTGTFRLDTTSLSPPEVLRRVGRAAEHRLGWRPRVPDPTTAGFDRYGPTVSTAIAHTALGDRF